MALQFSEAEIRVLGCLVEKEITTPEYYPLSLNALLNACNQKSNREPVLSLDENAVRQGLRSLTEQALVRLRESDSRVAKYEHRLNELYNFHRHEIAVLCVLLLRGPQTPGELRTRAERMYPFEDLEAVHSALNLLMRREPSLVKVLPRQPGTKESRYMHLFAGDDLPLAHTRLKNRSTVPRSLRSVLTGSPNWKLKSTPCEGNWKRFASNSQVSKNNFSRYRSTARIGPSSVAGASCVTANYFLRNTPRTIRLFHCASGPLPIPLPSLPVLILPRRQNPFAEFRGYRAYPSAWVRQK